MPDSTIPPLLRCPTGSPDDERPQFRRAALEAFDQPGETAESLRSLPSWLHRAPFLLPVSLVVGAALASIVPIPEHASGPAVIWLAGHRRVSAAISGTVQSVEVQAGDRVSTGQELLRFDDLTEREELAHVEQELELALAMRLHDPTDASTAGTLVSQRAQRQLARDRLLKRRVLAPSAGVVADVLVRPGEIAAVGQELLVLGRGTPQPWALAVLPGDERPRLRRGMPVRLRLAGGRTADERLCIESVDEDLLAASDATRLLGPAGEAQGLRGPVVILRGRLPSTTYVVDGETYTYRDGMPAQVEVVVGRRRLLDLLLGAIGRFLTGGRE